MIREPHKGGNTQMHTNNAAHTHTIHIHRWTNHIATRPHSLWYDGWCYSGWTLMAWRGTVDTHTHTHASYPLTSASSSSIHVKICVAKMDDTSNSWMSWVEAMTKQLRFAWETNRDRKWGNGEAAGRESKEKKGRLKVTYSYSIPLVTTTKIWVTLIIIKCNF